MSVDRDFFRLPDTSAIDGGASGSAWMSFSPNHMVEIWGERYGDGSCEIHYYDEEKGFSILISVKEGELTASLNGIASAAYDRASGKLTELVVGVGGMLLNVSRGRDEGISKEGCVVAEEMLAEKREFVVEVDLENMKVEFSNTKNGVQTEIIGDSGLEPDDDYPGELIADFFTPFDDVDGEVTLADGQVSLLLLGETKMGSLAVGSQVNLDMFLDNKRSYTSAQLSQVLKQIFLTAKL